MLCYNCMRDKGDRDICPFCNTGALKDPELHQLSPGTVIGGRYTVGKVLGEGGFGITYIGLDNTLDIVVAVKEYFPYGCSHRSSNITAEVSVSGGSGEVYRKGKDRFLKEAKTVAKFLKDPGIVDIRDFFEENNTAYIVMEYLEGVDLRKYLKAHGRLESEEAFRLLIPVMRSLEKMHRVGIIHRDISPDNIMYQPDGTLKLMDFGAARDYDDSRSMSVMLKHGYAPEEQYRRGGEQGPWTDVYGLCATIYRCITGKAPDEAIDRLAEDHLKKPSELGVTISPELEKALMYGLAVRKKDRCPDMTELLRLIDEAFNAEKTAPAVEIKPPEKGSVEEAKTTLADQPGVADEKTSLASDLPAGEEVKTTLAADMTVAGDPEPLIPKKPPVIPPVTPSEIPADTKKEKKPFPKAIIAVAAVLVAAIVILVIVNPFGGKQTKSTSKSEKATTVAATEKPTMFPVDEDTDEARQFERSVTYLMENVDLSGYDLYEDKETGKHYYTQEDPYGVDTAWELRDPEYVDLPACVTIMGIQGEKDGLKVTIGKDTLQDLLDAGCEYRFTDKDDLKSSSESQFVSLDYKGKSIVVYLAPTVGIKPENARIAKIDVYNIKKSAYDYEGADTDSIRSLISSIGNPTRYFIGTSSIYVGYQLSEDTDVSFQYSFDDPDIPTFKGMSIANRSDYKYS